MTKIAVFCSAAEGLPEKFKEAAQELGTWMGQNQKVLVYGGSYLGLMGVIAHAVRENGGQLYGFVPKRLTENGWEEPNLDVTFPCENLCDRKDLMLLYSEAVIALPGGVGTLDELFTAMGQNTMGESEKKIILLNIDGFYNTLIQFMKELSGKGLLRHPLEHYMLVANTVEELIPLLED